MRAQPDHAVASGSDAENPKVPCDSYTTEHFPSSFMKDDKKERKDVMQSLKRRDLLCRPKVSVTFFLAIFLVVGILSSAQLSVLHGHLHVLTEIVGMNTGNTGLAIREKSLRVAQAMAAMHQAGRNLSIAQWDMGSIQLNPFEFWMSRRDKHGYDLIMVNVETFMRNPKDRDVPVSAIFTSDMFQQLDEKIKEVGWPSAEKYYNEYKDRKIVTGFLRDQSITRKKLVINPDKVTSAIRVEDAEFPVSRPSVITMYDGLDEGNMKSLESWFSSWFDFMFNTELKVATDVDLKPVYPYQMLKPIDKSEVPDVTVDEAKDSLPLQLLSLAIFDAIMTHTMLVTPAPTDYEKVKRQIVQMLDVYRDENTLIILKEVYGDMDVLTLQRATAKFIEQARDGDIGKIYHVLSSKSQNSVADENAIILLRKETFPDGESLDITSLIRDSLKEESIGKGEIFAVSATDLHGIPYVVVSFRAHDDGLNSNPVLHAIVKTMDSDPSLSDNVLLVGMESNTYEKGVPGERQDVMDFGRHYLSHGLTSCWGDMPQPKNYTTFLSRTYLQPRYELANSSLNKTRNDADRNPKDFILFWRRHFNIIHTWKDNQSMRRYAENYPFRTLAFPGDHAVVATVLKPSIKEEPDKTS